MQKGVDHGRQGITRNRRTTGYIHKHSPCISWFSVVHKPVRKKNVTLKLISPPLCACHLGILCVQIPSEDGLTHSP